MKMTEIAEVQKKIAEMQFAAPNYLAFILNCVKTVKKHILNNTHKFTRVVSQK